MCEKLPLWTGIMVPIYGYGAKVGSRTTVESYFNELKINFLGRGECLRVDNFLMQHIKLNDGSLKIAGSTSMFQDGTDETIGENAEERTTRQTDLQNDKNSQQENVYCTNVSSCVACSIGNNPEGAHKCIVCQKAVHALDGCSLPVDEGGYGQKRKCMTCVNRTKSIKVGQTSNVSGINRKNEQVNPVVKELAQFENWRNQGAENNRKKSFYLAPCPEIAHVDENASKHRIKIRLLKNGNCIKLKPRRLGKTQVVLENTCAFDIISQGIAVCLCDSVKYREVVNVKME